MEFDLYKDIQKRTGGEIYIGVFGPVRTGKSTFIKRFMELFVLPFMDNVDKRTRAMDELPQAAQGTMVMTTEPKFIPQEAAQIEVEQGCSLKVRLVDCVGFMVDGASGHMDGNNSRMVQTPWFQEEVPFSAAAEYGTNKVIQEHSTVGIVVTTDGSFGEIPRENYLEAEAKAIHEMESIGKPFVILLNCQKPHSEDTRKLVEQMKEQYDYPVMAVNCMQLKKEDISEILQTILLEFPISQVNFYVPKWTQTLPLTHPVKESLITTARQLQQKFIKMRQVFHWKNEREDKTNKMISSIYISAMTPSDGTVSLKIEMDESYYYAYISEMAQVPIEGECELISMIQDLSRTKRDYEKLKDALDAVARKGYGVVLPELADFVVDAPELISHGNKFGVKMHAVAPSVHMIKTNIETEIAPIVGSEEQAMDLITYIKDTQTQEEGLWNANIFGKSVGELLEEGMRTKLQQMDEECQQNIMDSMQKIVNDSNGGMICIII